MSDHKKARSRPLLLHAGLETYRHVGHDPHTRLISFLHGAMTLRSQFDSIDNSSGCHSQRHVKVYICVHAALNHTPQNLNRGRCPQIKGILNRSILGGTSPKLSSAIRALFEKLHSPCPGIMVGASLSITCAYPGAVASVHYNGNGQRACLRVFSSLLCRTGYSNIAVAALGRKRFVI